MEQAASELIAAINQAVPLLQQIEEDRASLKPSAAKWSPKEILGHLIDSAGNNQQKFVRTMINAEQSFPAYDQDKWVSLQQYNSRNWQEIISLWYGSNLHLAHVIRNIPEQALKHQLRIGANEPCSLAFMADDYVRHLKHHLKAILG